MEAEEAADRGLVLAPFSLLDGERGVVGGRQIYSGAKWSALFQRGPAAISREQTQKTDAPVCRAGSRSRSNKRPRLRPGTWTK